MKKLIRTKGTEFEQNGYDMAIIDTNFRAGKPIMLNSKDLDMAILNGEKDALDSIETDDTLNIFFQEYEPAIKNGIWFETNKYRYDKLSFVSKMPFLGTAKWRKFSSTGTALMSTYTAGVMNGTLYIFGGQTYSSGGTIKTTMINTTTGSRSEPFLNSSMELDTTHCNPVVVGNLMYITGKYGGIGSPRAYTFDGSNFTWISDKVSQVRQDGTAVAIDKDIYLIGGRPYYGSYYSTILKINTEDYTNTELPIPFTPGTRPFAAAVGTDIYILYSSTVWKFDTLTNECTEVCDNQFKTTGWCFSEGTDIYMFKKAGPDVCKFDTITNRFTPLTVANRIYGSGSVVCYDPSTKTFFDTPSALNGANSTTVYKFKLEELTPASYPEDTVIVEQATENKYATILTKSKALIEGEDHGIITNFNDAGYFNTVDGGIGTLPTYYGDGTQWIKFKN